MDSNLEPAKISWQGEASFKDIDLTKKESIAKEFGKGYKDILISISNNDTDVISDLKKWPK